MDVLETAEEIADFLWDLLTQDRFQSPQNAYPQELLDALTAALADQGLTQEDLNGALEQMSLQAGAGQSAEIAALRQSVELLPSQIVVHAPSGPAPEQVVRHVSEQRVTHVTENNTLNNTLNQTNIKEGDTNVNNTTVTEINALGDVDFDQTIDNSVVTADDGGVAVGGDVTDSAVNTGINTGVIAGDDVGIEDSIIGDGNDQVNDTLAGAVATGSGNATAAQGENVNVGSGDLNDVNALGDGQVTSGTGNAVEGSTDISVNAPAPSPSEAVDSSSGDALLAPPEADLLMDPMDHGDGLGQDPLTDPTAIDDPFGDDLNDWDDDDIEL